VLGARRPAIWRVKRGRPAERDIVKLTRARDARRALVTAAMVAVVSVAAAAAASALILLRSRNTT
jgi:hypothetical protein